MHIRLLRWKHVQNRDKLLDDFSDTMPDCPCQGTFKTGWPHWKEGTTKYQIAPVRARSKRLRAKSVEMVENTRLPLSGHVQNLLSSVVPALTIIPDCPCQGTFKTACNDLPVEPMQYQIAPVRARSKPTVIADAKKFVNTRLPLSGHVQNDFLDLIKDEKKIPDCPCQGTFKTLR